jgi:hypothetical protein
MVVRPRASVAGGEEMASEAARVAIEGESYASFLEEAAAAAVEKVVEEGSRCEACGVVWAAN